MMAKDLRLGDLKDDAASVSQRILRTTMHAIARNKSNGFGIASTEAPPPVPPTSLYNSTNYDANDREKLYEVLYYIIYICFMTLTMGIFMLLCYLGCCTNFCDDWLKESRRNDDVAETITPDAMLRDEQRPERSSSQTFSSKCFVILDPPPTYESIFNPRTVPPPLDKKDESDNFDIIVRCSTSSFSDELEANWIHRQKYLARNDQGLPSYEAALKLEANGYV